MNYAENIVGKKIIPFDTLCEWRDRKIGNRIVVTNGCFDILHIGHISYLMKCGSLGTHFLIGVNDDKSVKQLKGQNRPIIPESDRALMLASYNFVNSVCIFPGLTAIEFLKCARPDVYVKGADYDMGTMDKNEKEVLIKNESEILFQDFIEGKSTTSIINRIM